MELVKIVDSFNSIIKRMVNVIYANATEKQRINGLFRYKSLIFNIINYDPTSVIENVGQILDDNKEIIHSHNVMNLQEGDVDTILDKNVVSSNENAQGIVSMVKEIYPQLNDGDKQVIVDAMEELLALYHAYLKVIV